VDLLRGRRRRRCPLSHRRRGRRARPPIAPGRGCRTCRSPRPTAGAIPRNFTDLDAHPPWQGLPYPRQPATNRGSHASEIRRRRRVSPPPLAGLPYLPQPATNRGSHPSEFASLPRIPPRWQGCRICRSPRPTAGAIPRQFVDLDAHPAPLAGAAVPAAARNQRRKPYLRVSRTSPRGVSAGGRIPRIAWTALQRDGRWLMKG
jgi:hypothetical protein